MHNSYSMGEGNAKTGKLWMGIVVIAGCMHPT